MEGLTTALREGSVGWIDCPVCKHHAKLVRVGQSMVGGQLKVTLVLHCLALDCDTEFPIDIRTMEAGRDTHTDVEFRPEKVSRRSHLVGPPRRPDDARWHGRP